MEIRTAYCSGIQPTSSDCFGDIVSAPTEKGTRSDRRSSQPPEDHHPSVHPGLCTRSCQTSASNYAATGDGWTSPQLLVPSLGLFPLEVGGGCCIGLLQDPC